MSKIANVLESMGYILRSGGAPGADQAFERGVIDSTRKEIYLPSRRWLGNPSPYYTVSEEAIDLARKYHPNFKALSPFAQLLMGRNVYQVLGKSLNQASCFVVCYTPDGCDMDRVSRSPKTGGTGQALSIAKEYHIPIFNLYYEDSEIRLTSFLKMHNPSGS
jgi:hypothetical protein